MANTIKQIILLGAILALAGIVGASVFLGGSAEKVSATNTITGNAAKTISNNGQVQEVKLTFKNYQYQLEPSTLQKDVPVRMTVDLNSVSGCMRDVVIPSFGVKKYVSSNDNVIEFTPDKAGTFNIACSMNMGRGRFDVVDSSGSTSGFVEEAPAEVAGGSCGGASAGGCGCGG